MLDLSKPLGTVDGLVLFADHEEPGRIHYLPDEIALASAADGTPDLELQVFYEDEAILDTGGDPDAAVGAVLSLGVRCGVGADRLRRVRDAVVADQGREVTLTAPPWEDGTVELLLLDTQGTPAPGEQRMVSGVVGSRRPSLSDGTLSALFHAKLDRRGTALLSASLATGDHAVAGVLYDLTFSALRPSVQLRMSADLDAVAEAIRVGLGVQVYYVAADVSATFASMRDNGVIRVDVLTQDADPETKRAVDEAVTDFYDVLMRELFRPALSPGDVAGLPTGAGSVQSSIVKLSFAYSRGTRSRTVVVDYRQRSACRRTHNPAAHLRGLAQLVAGREWVRRVPLGAAWRQSRVEVAAPGVFDGEPALLKIDVVLWRGAAGVLADGAGRDGGLRMPADVEPLAQFAFARTDASPRLLRWVLLPGEPPYYYWQARFTYAPEDGVDSPAELWSEPHRTGSADLDLFPAVLTPRHQATLVLGAGHDDDLVGVEAAVVARSGTGTVLGGRTLRVDASAPTATWARRGAEADRISLEAALTYRYAGGRRAALPAQTLVDRELIANQPFAGTVTLSPLVTGTTTSLLEVRLEVSYADPDTGYRHLQVVHLRAPEFRADDVRIPVLRLGDTVSWDAVAVPADGPVRPVGSGTSRGGILVLVADRKRRVRVEWIGRDLADAGLRWVRVTVRSRDAAGATEDSATVEWRPGAAATVQEVGVDGTGRVEWAVERRDASGARTAEPFRPVEGGLVVVSE